MFRAFFKHQWVAVIVIFAICALVSIAVAAEPDQDGGIVWYTPVTSTDSVAPADEAPVLAVVENCTVAENTFMAAWLATGPRPINQREYAQIVIVIDDMGIDKRRSARMARLPSQLTLAFLPYAPNVQAQVDAAAAMGHEIMMHVPMQPQDTRIDPGPNVLLSDLTANELHARILANLNAFEGYAGINNHMGSQFTQDRAGLEMLMAELKKRNVFFLDSKTHPRSIAEKMAVKADVRAAHRDVFLDHVETPQAVASALALAEREARRQGIAIVIGHPKDVTINGLAAWLPHLKDKGIEVVKLGDVLKNNDALRAAHHTSAQPTGAAVAIQPTGAAVAMPIP